MTPSLEGLPTKAKEAPSPPEVRLAPLVTNPVFQNLGGVFIELELQDFIFSNKRTVFCQTISLCLKLHTVLFIAYQHNQVL